MDRMNLPTGSYSKLDMLITCGFQFKFKYLQGQYVDTKAVYLDVGNLCHKVLEIKGRTLIEDPHAAIDYMELNDILKNGCQEETEKGSERIAGADEIKKNFFQDWYTPDNKSGLTYEEKMDLFQKFVLPNRMEASEWKVIAVEQPFEFVYDDRIILHGFIDRIDMNQNGELRVTDYKTGKAAFDDKKLATPLQMVVYALACVAIYEKLPVSYEYDFILIDEKRRACSPGYLKRGINKLNKILDTMEDGMKNDSFCPHPSPLCYYCSYAAINPNADIKTKNLCEYYSLWRPDSKTFAVNKIFNKEEPEQKRKLVF